MVRLVLASASPRRRELLTQCGFTFDVYPAHIPESPLPGEDPIAYVTRLAREKAEAVYRELTMNDPLVSESRPGAPDMPGKSTGAGQGSSFPNFSAKDAERIAHPRSLGSHPAIVVLGADTTVTLDGHILEKPEDAADAARMLRILSGRTHRVITGVAVVSPDRTEVAAEVTAVRFLPMNDDEIAAYVATGEPMDKAGAYGIQGRAARWIPRVEGCYFNVVGLPLALVGTLLESAGVR